MTTENKTLEQLRDELADDYFDYLDLQTDRLGENFNPYKATDTAFKAGFDASTAIHQERIKKLVKKIWKVKCTGPNQKEVLADLYKIAEEISQEWGEK